MLSRPESVTDESVRQAVQHHWSVAASEISYLAVGFGAHHWRVGGAQRQLFVTLDELAPRHTTESLENAYAGAAVLAASGLEFVWPSLPATSGRFTVDFAGTGGALSVTPWLTGTTPSEAEAAEPAHLREVIALLDRLHRARPPAGLRRWRPRVDADFPRQLAAATARPWLAGPLGEQARTAIRAELDQIGRWTDRYRELAAVAQRHQDRWVPTHGEPHHANQVVTSGGVVLVDWESLMLAPRERDLADLIEAGAADDLDPDWAMVELFALDWRLAEIGEYTRWFTRAHSGNEDDHVALEGLREELHTP
ncbi:spectinomycin phosphotransferase [Goodfellowiella coeruleoviolacea]|uniref:Spectinomycin phosphotransferase n=1 Tax=Goodfellowiella coeruleoviolacea TaxID=334858 RepID=A0AAE3KL24_9PSEU|nr:spectinomycin phosphotransferase [Goodfellowiella coeruleoviolacea]